MLNAAELCKFYTMCILPNFFKRVIFFQPPPRTNSHPPWRTHGRGALAQVRRVWMLPAARLEVVGCAPPPPGDIGRRSSPESCAHLATRGGDADGKMLVVITQRQPVTDAPQPHSPGFQENHKQPHRLIAPSSQRLKVNFKLTPLLEAR